MKINSIKTAGDILELKLGELYDIENQVVKALTKLSKKATHEELRNGFQQHLEETNGQVRRLEMAFETLECKPHKVKSEGIRGIISDGETLLASSVRNEVKDALLVSSARAVEHFEMATYLVASELANMLGHTEVERLLKESYEEEVATEKRLSKLSMQLSRPLHEQSGASDAKSSML